MSKRPLDIEEKENEEPSSSTEPIRIKRSKTVEDAEEEEFEDEEDDEENEPLPIGAVIEHNEGTLHPTNKEYFIYEKTEPSMISKTARFWSRKYLKALHHVNPDTYEVNSKSSPFIFDHWFADVHS